MLYTTIAKSVWIVVTVNPKPMGVITYKRIRMAGHVAAVLAAVSLIRGLILYTGDVGDKMLLLGFLFFAWFAIIPVVPAFHSMMPRSPVQQFNYRLTKFIAEIIFPPIIIAAFLWMTFTTWKRPSNERPLSDVFHEIGNGPK
jgi:hypothetical protein